MRKGARPRVAVVQRSKDKLWVLPRGKLKRDERPVTGARREVVEETGFRVQVGEFLGVMTYQARGRPKVVQFWLMRAESQPSYELMKDIAAVEWLTLAAAVKRLSHPLEKLFLTHVGQPCFSQARTCPIASSSGEGKVAGRKVRAYGESASPVEREFEA